MENKNLTLIYKIAIVSALMLICFLLYDIFSESGLNKKYGDLKSAKIWSKRYLEI
jgi:hypothetical protein